MTGIINIAGARSGEVGTTSTTITAGQLLGIATANDTTQGGSGSSTWQTKATTAPVLTVSDSGSNVLLIATVYCDPQGDTMYLDFKDQNGRLSGANDGVAKITGDDEGTQTITIVVAHASSAGTGMTYQIMMRNSNNSTTQYIGDANIRTTLTAMEMAA